MKMKKNQNPIYLATQALKKYRQFEGYFQTCCNTYIPGHFRIGLKMSFNHIYLTFAVWVWVGQESGFLFLDVFTEGTE